jgi:hypothetical protein
MRIRTALLATPAVIALLAAPAAHADWRGHGGWHGPHPVYHHGWGPGPVIAGALLGLGAAAVIAGAVAPPPVYYAPPPVYYAPPPPAYYAPPPAYYTPPPSYNAW